MSDIQLIKNARGENKCPAGKIALYTNINYNEQELGDILIISRDIQLNRQQLESYGFYVGGHDGVSSVVNKMSQNGTLVSGLYLDGETLSVAAGESIPSLVSYPLGKGTWNDATQSVVARPVETVNLTMSLENISFALNKAYVAELTIANKSNIAVSGLTLDVSSANNNVVSVGNVAAIGTLPANGSVKVSIPLTGKSIGSTSLTSQLHTPIGVINSGANQINTRVSVTAINVELTMSVASNLVLTSDETYYNVLNISNSESSDIKGVSVGVTVSDSAIVSVGYFPPSVDISAGKSVNINIPLMGENPGTATMTAKLTMPNGYTNNGDSQASSVIQVTEQRDLDVSQEYKSHWRKQWDKPEFLYSYHFLLTSSSVQVRSWQLSFLLPEGAMVDVDWLNANSSWIELNTDKSVNGWCFLDSTKGNVIAPGIDLPMDILMIYPGEAEEYKVINNLRLEQLA
ncbi:hypothetical protein PL78_18785 [Yersinia entomophaga]|uniref:Uncharacterized protein n=1 Tax=Yersinia entomophaga TaxID=935293 RepID=A0ABN4PY41_YERET|nr:hypothetical protein [Yersinia entomophaga]ANI31858.1 hypothetical protein PL78_18785 [Yersinia entomophaga]OWF86726.1 hypothetical protein B4914_14190 [Yersinia entomophaga]